MTREQIDRLWQKALHESVTAGEQFTRYNFAALVAAAEREECAKVCEETTAAWTQTVYNEACMHCASAIRARNGND